MSWTDGRLSSTSTSKGKVQWRSSSIALTRRREPASSGRLSNCGCETWRRGNHWCAIWKDGSGSCVGRATPTSTVSATFSSVGGGSSFYKAFRRRAKRPRAKRLRSPTTEWPDFFDGKEVSPNDNGKQARLHQRG